jgi:hypothetical protein
MKANPYTGDVPIDLDGTIWRLRYDWVALAAVKTELGGDLEPIVTGQDLAGLAAMIEIGLRRQHGDDHPMTRAVIQRDPPPVTRACAAVTEAIDLAWNGPRHLRPPVPGENPPTRARRLAAAIARMLPRRRTKSPLP